MVSYFFGFKNVSIGPQLCDRHGGLVLLLISGFGRCYHLSVKYPAQAHVLECWSPVGETVLNHFVPLWMVGWGAGTGSKG